ncbi:hydrolase [Corynebacterium yudongzhengii]|uniref:Hydrolase n=1 Tax=Corynebacterium yudongzhengii TaxID=2080740 RepID=A0A2U1T4Z2_9CORY|nr:zinc-dependent metalloprotease [Corynebacterium yudongzhengii]AWB81432.1 hydrolase [Corynebacterium yudongzhengii]PWC01070.1 hydrolase [Corynebacterium yudongzhengii]
MSNGFGFSFNNDDDDDDRRRDQNQNPFGAFGFGAGGSGGSGGLGDILNQFGQMLSGMGTSMNSEEGRGSVNYDLAGRIARQQIGSVSRTSSQDATAVAEATRLAELWLDEATTLPSVSGTVTAWNAQDWLEHTLPKWKRMVSPVAEHMNEAQLEALPAEAREMMGPMGQMMQQMSSMNFGMQLGHALGDLAKQALTGSDFGLPVAPDNTIALLPANVQGAARELNLPSQEVMVYIAAREAARQRLFTHVPWLVERLVSSVEEYAAGLVIDTSHIEEATRELNLDSGDPQAMQEALGRLQGMDLSPRITSRNAAAVSRLETLLALVEGWAEYVVNEALGERIPSAEQLSEAWKRRRASGGSAENAFSKVVGIEFAAPKVADAVELWRRSTVAVGIERRDKVWDHPDFLPAAEHLDAPAEFIDGLLDDSEDKNFDEEFAKLEEMLRQEDNEEDNKDDDEGTER